MSDDFSGQELFLPSGYDRPGIFADCSHSIKPRIPRLHFPEVTITNSDTKVSTSTLTDESGDYTVLYLTPGPYQVSVEMLGFKKLERSGIELRIGDRLTLDLQLQLGGVQQEVRVTAGTPLLQTAEASAGQIIDERLSSKTMESRKVPGLFFIGEVVDVTGHLGGFNLQWAWASGAAAGRSV
ncbi:MAG: hypothetical protein DMG38_26245 [Acidobacteria bacterium]|nr:MAG: hypothetical protein DMG38_26245 [Acidobacteriota bacterium]